MLHFDLGMHYNNKQVQDKYSEGIFRNALRQEYHVLTTSLPGLTKTINKSRIKNIFKPLLSMQHCKHYC